MTLLEQVKKAFQNVRSSMVVAMQALHVVKESGEWKEASDTWGDYVETELGISQGFASKLLTVNHHYLLSGHVSQEKLVGIDYEKLYLAAKTGGTPEEQIEKARLLSRSELRAEREDTNDHTHEWIEICKHCSMRKQ